MGTARRAYDLLRGYVNREWDRIQGLDLENAQRELDDSLTTVPPKTAQPLPQPEAVVRSSNEDRARRILGVPADATFDQVRRAFERLNKRSEPANFPLGSIEREHAVAIQKSVQWAYTVLTAKVDIVEKRFRSLEID